MNMTNEPDPARASAEAVTIWREDFEYATKLASLTNTYARNVLRDAVAWLYMKRVFTPDVMLQLGGEPNDMLNDYTPIPPKGEMSASIETALDAATLRALEALQAVTCLSKKEILRLAMMRHWNWTELVRNPESQKTLVPTFDLDDLTCLGQLLYGGH